jgi:dipeptidyl aminopeptidase/acylaminoacyl peptidase
MHAQRILACSLSAAALTIGCTQEPVEPSREIRQYAVEDFLDVTDYRGISFSPDASKILVSSDIYGVYNAYAISVGQGDVRQLTASTTDSVFAEAYFPHDERFLFRSDQGGNELDHLYVQELDGTVRDLTPGEELKADLLGFTHDGGSFIVTTNERDSRFFDVYEYATGDYEREMIFRNDQGYELRGITPDERYLALLKVRTVHDSDIYLFDRETAELEHLTPHEGDIANTPQAFSADGSGLYYTTDEASEFAYLVRYDLASGDRETLLEADWDVWFATPSKLGKFIVVGINNDARTQIQVYDTETMIPLELPEIPEGDISSLQISDDETKVAFYLSASRQPRDPYIWDLEGEPRQLVGSFPTRMDAADLVDGQVVRFASYDGLEIPGILYKPHQASSEDPAPALVWVHGGPGGQSRIDYNAPLQYLVNHGYVVYAINNRGSSGYGKTFYRADDRKHGEADLGDCVASRQMLIDTGYVDPNRIGIIGGSYGGYMVLAALTLEPEAFAVGVDIFGISNWIRTLESIPAWWESFRQALYVEMGDPSEDAERLRRISPLFNADSIRRPLMVLQGANDPRVLKVESDEIVEAARANGVEVEYLLFEDEGHGFEKKENRLRGYRAIREFLDRHLKGVAIG